MPRVNLDRLNNAMLYFKQLRQSICDVKCKIVAKNLDINNKKFKKIIKITIGSVKRMRHLASLLAKTNCLNICENNFSKA